MKIESLNWKRDISLALYSTFLIGGKAKYFISISNIEEMNLALRFCSDNRIPYFILGKGSNILFDDRGFNGAVILNKIQFLEQKGSLFTAGGGYSFSLLGLRAARMGFSGLEYAAGIPASVGGAVFMNAGADKQEIADTISSVEFIHDDGTKKLFQKAQLQFDYRFSSFQHLNGVIVSASFNLKKVEGVRAKQLILLKRRKDLQPGNEHCAGCVFRNPKGSSAGFLIDQIGLKGYSKGDAQVSLKHANFIVNKGKALAGDVLELISYIQDKVKQSKGVTLRPEVRYIPYE